MELDVTVPYPSSFRVFLHRQCAAVPDMLRKQSLNFLYPAAGLRHTQLMVLAAVISCLEPRLGGLMLGLWDTVLLADSKGKHSEGPKYIEHGGRKKSLEAKQGHGFSDVCLSMTLLWPGQLNWGQSSQEWSHQGKKRQEGLEKSGMTQADRMPLT